MHHEQHLRFLQPASEARAASQAHAAYRAHPVSKSPAPSQSYAVSPTRPTFPPGGFFEAQPRRLPVFR